MSRVHVVGQGIVAGRVHRMLADLEVIVHDPRWGEVGAVTEGDIAILAHGGDQVDEAARLVARGIHVVTTGDALDDIRHLLDLDVDDVSLVVGAAMAPGLSGLIARHLGDQLAGVDEIHVAIHGTAGPACARQHHRSLSGISVGWHDGRWHDHLGGSGRELCWFPEPLGAMDCYRAALASPLVLHETFPSAERITVRRSARRRDRLTAWMPMLSPPHREGSIGGLRVEVRGVAPDGGRECLIAGIAEPVGTVTAAVAAVFTRAVLDGAVHRGIVLAGDERLPTIALLRAVEQMGIRLQEFTGVPQPTARAVGR